MKTKAFNWIRIILKTALVKRGNRWATAGLLVGAVGLGLGEASSRLESTHLAVLDRGTRLAPARLSWKSNLGSSRTGRVILHTVCLIRHPQKASWHWHGILREFSAGLPFAVGAHTPD